MNMKEWLFPWHSNVMIEHPFALPIFMFITSLLLSIVTWIMQSRKRHKE